jgi:hypothetical protein
MSDTLFGMSLLCLMGFSDAQESVRIGRLSAASGRETPSLKATLKPTDKEPTTA